MPLADDVDDCRKQGHVLFLITAGQQRAQFVDDGGFVSDHGSQHLSDAFRHNSMPRYSFALALTDKTDHSQLRVSAATGFARRILTGCTFQTDCPVTGVSVQLAVQSVGATWPGSWTRASTGILKPNSRIDAHMRSIA